MAKRRELVELKVQLNEYNNVQIAEQGSDPNQLYETVDLGISSYGRDTRVAGMQYRFPTWAISGSEWTLIDSIGKDYYEPLQPIISSSRASSVFDSIIYPYDGGDMLRGSGSFLRTENYVYTGSSALSPTAPYVGKYGFTFNTTTDGVWYLKASEDKLVTNYSTTFGSASFTSPLLISGSTYQISVDINTSGSGFGYTYATASVCIRLGGSTSPTAYTGSTMSIPGGSGAVTTTQTITFTGIATGPYLYIETGIGGSNKAYGEVQFDNLKVYTTTNKAEMQDYMVGPEASAGMRNARYDGCKLTSSDYNTNSPDTIDRGPVITVLQTDSNELIVKPTKRGTFSVE
jgi:hypothetical protein